MPFHLNLSSSHEIIPCDRCQLIDEDFRLKKYFKGGGVGGNSGDGDSIGMQTWKQGGHHDESTVGDGAIGNLRGSNAENIENQWRHDLFPYSCNNNRCDVEQKYTEGSSWTAFEVRDKVWLGLNGEIDSVEEHKKFSTPFVFGCQVSEEGLFRTQVCRYDRGRDFLAGFYFSLALSSKIPLIPQYSCPLLRLKIDA